MVPSLGSVTSGTCLLLVNTIIRPGIPLKKWLILFGRLTPLVLQWFATVKPTQLAVEIPGHGCPYDLHALTLGSAASRLFDSGDYARCPGDGSSKHRRSRYGFGCVESAGRSCKWRPCSWCSKSGKQRASSWAQGCHVRILTVNAHLLKRWTCCCLWPSFNATGQQQEEWPKLPTATLQRGGEKRTGRRHHHLPLTTEDPGITTTSGNQTCRWPNACYIVSRIKPVGMCVRNLQPKYAKNIQSNEQWVTISAYI